MLTSNSGVFFEQCLRFRIKKYILKTDIIKNNGVYFEFGQQGIEYKGKKPSFNYPYDKNSSKNLREICAEFHNKHSNKILIDDEKIEQVFMLFFEKYNI